MEIFDLTTPAIHRRVGMIQVERYEMEEFFDPDEFEYMESWSATNQ